jgi:hypothetical protein
MLGPCQGRVHLLNARIHAHACACERHGTHKIIEAHQGCACVKTIALLASCQGQHARQCVSWDDSVEHAWVAGEVGSEYMLCGRCERAHFLQGTDTQGTYTLAQNRL